jgi:3-hydroxyisobutyrate dehydrogenase
VSETTTAPVTTDRVGFIGLGSQGGPMARQIVDAGFPTVLWARRQESLDPYRDTSAEYAASPAELASRSDLVGVCVLDDAAVTEVVTGSEGILAGMAPGGVIAIHSTVHPETVIRLAEQAAAQGIALLDAPVSGGGQGAAARTLLVMVGGDTETLERCRPALATFGSPIVHLGPVGAGQRAKLINNLTMAANLGVLASAYAIARTLDVDPAQLATVLRHGSARSFVVDVIPGPDYTLDPIAAMAGPLLQKDARLIVDLTGPLESGADTALIAADAALGAMGFAR